ncbi:MAG: response regulator [Methylococcaceae bacterium]|nr:response regulator [Methylococcaceae bacterium]MDD1607083.1 response regulator [Methylococcaceae bacterium]MDD1609704.1 response regulator [Methylococcaceae bacterium]MDD1615361.1 response regulator [Methylococcaceae bacterium]OYV20536.1 MAG: rcp [Methylococcaceae bacterium NSP1-2]
MNPLHTIEILLLEDEVADAYLVKIALKENKILARLHHVVDGYEGLGFLQQRDNYSNVPRPDLILLDLNMPRMNGYEFLAAIKSDERFKGIPVLVLSTSDVESDVISSYQLGAASYITKPVSIEQFIAVINKISEYWMTVVRLPRRYKYEC